VEYWCDRSGLRHHAQRGRDSSYAIDVLADDRGVDDAILRRALRLGGNPDGNWLLVPDDDGALLLDDHEFTVFVGARVPTEEELFGSRPSVDLFKATGLSWYELSLGVYPAGTAQALLTQNAQAVAVAFSSEGWYDSRYHLYVMRRASDVGLELRINGESRFAFGIPSDLRLTSPQNIGFLLGTGDVQSPAPSGGGGQIAFVAAFIGALSLDEVERVETFLCGALGLCLPPDPPTIVEPGDAG
jgi:hypothetical protein